jgi:hypothetical protein
MVLRVPQGVKGMSDSRWVVHLSVFDAYVRHDYCPPTSPNVEVLILDKLLGFLRSLPGNSVATDFSHAITPFSSQLNEIIRLLYNWRQKFNSLPSAQNQLENLSQNLYNEIIGLPYNGFLVFPCGYFNPYQTHGYPYYSYFTYSKCCFVVQKQANGQYTWVLCNSIDSGYHARSNDAMTAKYYPYVKVENVQQKFITLDLCW